MDLNIKGGLIILFNYLSERITNILQNGDIISAYFYFWKFIVVLIYDLTTKASVAFPVFTALGPTILYPSLVFLQFVANIWLNHWWAEGNILLIVGQLFTLWQFVSMMLLIWDVEWYLY